MNKWPLSLLCICIQNATASSSNNYWIFDFFKKNSTYSMEIIALLDS